MADKTDTGQDSIRLLYPYYLDVDMSMAFAAALTGGVALEEHQQERAEGTSKAIKSLRGNLKVLSALGLGGVDAEKTGEDTSGTTMEIQSTRHHTLASIFIDLYDEMRQAGLLSEQPKLEEMALGDIVSLQMGPATAPLRRVVDQVIRLLEVTMPMVGLDEPADSPSKNPSKRQRQAAQQAGSPGGDGLRQLHRVLVGLRDDLAKSGMVDVLVGAADRDAPRAVLTLDRRFLSETALELLHTSSFTVVGKVTQLWPTDDDVVNLYRRSVVSLAPSLTQATMWALFTLVGLITKAIDANKIQRDAEEALQVSSDKGATARPGDEATPEGDAPAGAPGAKDQQAVASSETSSDEIQFANEMIAAVTPYVTGPAFQILPLAVCA